MRTADSVRQTARLPQPIAMQPCGDGDVVIAQKALRKIPCIGCRLNRELSGIQAFNANRAVLRIDSRLLKNASIHTNFTLNAPRGRKADRLTPSCMAKTSNLELCRLPRLSAYLFRGWPTIRRYCWQTGQGIRNLQGGWRKRSACHIFHNGD